MTPKSDSPTGSGVGRHQNRGLKMAGRGAFLTTSSIRYWVLMAAALAALFYLSRTETASATGYLVDTNSDASITACTPAPGDCSLRGAITNANTSGFADVITFDAGLGTIALGSALPPLTGGGETITGSGSGVIVDGVTQTFDCLTLASNGNIVQGIEVRGCADGITITGASNTIGGTLGTTPSGACTGPCNTISDNNPNGVWITGASATGNQVMGNHIGTNAAGIVAGPGNNTGVMLDGGSSGNTVGGATTSHRNIISGNSVGVGIVGSSGQTVQGNYIGLDPTGAALGNSVGIFGVTMTGSTISGNVISSNAISGISISGASTGNQILGNLIGTDPTATMARGNGNGLNITAGSNNTIGTTISPNTIAYNTRAGICISGTSTVVGYAIRANSIHSNTQLGIDLNNSSCGTSSVTLNDAGDGDGGPNGLQNFPVLTAAETNGANTLVVGSLNTTASTPVRIDFYSSPSCDGSGNGEGRTYLGTLATTTDGSGNASFNYSALPPSTIGHAITATATRDSAPLSTSEFSACAISTLGIANGAWAAAYSQGSTTQGDCQGGIVGPGTATTDGGSQWICEVNHTVVAAGGTYSSSWDISFGGSPFFSGSVSWLYPSAFTTTFLGMLAADGMSSFGSWNSPSSSGTFTAALKVATTTAPGQTVTGTGSSLNFGGTSSGGSTAILPAAASGGTLPPTFSLVGQYYHVITSVTGGGPFTFCGTYAGGVNTTNDVVGGTPETNVQIGHLLSTGWEFLARSAGSDPLTNTVCGVSTSLSEFAIVACGDTDTDAVCNPADNCVSVANTNQANMDGDPYGDVCEAPGCEVLYTQWEITTSVNDSDCDGFTTAIETHVGTDATTPTGHCAATGGANNEAGMDRWPADFDDNQLATTLDLVVYVTALNTATGNPNYVQRADLNGNGNITTLDLVAYVYMLNKKCA